MRFILGVFVGAALLIGSGYLHDIGVVAGRAEEAIRQLGYRDRNVRAVSPLQNFSIHGRNSISHVQALRGWLSTCR